MDEDARRGAAAGVGSAEPVEPAAGDSGLARRGRRHEAVGAAFPVLFRQVGADQHDLAGKGLPDRGRFALQAAQHVDKPIGRHGLQRPPRRQQHLGGHRRPLGAIEQRGGKGRQALAAFGFDPGLGVPENAVQVGDQLGVADRPWLRLAGVGPGIEYGGDERRCRIRARRARQHDPVSGASQRGEKIAIVLSADTGEAVGGVAEDDVEADGSGIGVNRGR